MDLDDSFTRNLLHRTMARREQINKKLGLTPEVSEVSSKRRRTPLADENNVSEDELTQYEADSSESPKRQRVSTPIESCPPLQDNKENSPTMPVLGLKGLAALKRRNQDSIADPAATKLSNASKQLEHEVQHEQAFLTDKTNPRSRLANLAKQIDQWEDQSLASQNKRLTKSNLTNNTSKSSLTKTLSSSQIPSCSNTASSSSSSFASISKPVASKGDGGAGGKKNGTLESGNQREPGAEVKSKRNTPQQESQGFTKSPSTTKLSYAYPDADPSTSTIKDRLKMFENSSASSSAPKLFVQHATLPKKPSVGPARGAPLSQLTIHVSSVPTPGGIPSHDVDPAEMSLSAKKALFEAPIQAKPMVEDQSPEKLTVSQRTALFERAMLSPGSKTKSRAEGRVPSPVRRVSPPSPVPVMTAPSPSKHRPPSPVHHLSPAPVHHLPPAPVHHLSPAPVHHLSPAPVHHLPLAPVHHLPPAPSAKPFVPSTSPKPVSVSPHQATVPSTKPSPSILRKSDGHVTNGVTTKTVTFNLSPCKLPANEVSNTQCEQRIPEAPKSPKLGTNTHELQQRLLGQIQKSTSTSRMVEKSIAQRKKEMERLLFNKQAEPEQEDSLLSQDDDSDVNSTFTIETSVKEGTVQCDTPEVVVHELNEIAEEEEESYLDESASLIHDVLSFEDKSEVTDDKSEMTDDSQQLQTSEREKEPVPNRMTPQQPVPNYMTPQEPEPNYMTPQEPEPNCMTPQLRPLPERDYSSEVPEQGSVSLTHSVSVYRRQKQALCTPPVRVIQRNTPPESPPPLSPPQNDPYNVEELHARIQFLQENLHCQEVQVRQASQALSLCIAKPELFGTMEHIEGERLLLIACHKRNAYRTSLERLKTEAALGRTASDSNATGTLTLSDIRLPLKHDFLSAHMAGLNGDSIHFFFCLIRYQDKVIATEMLSTKAGDITAGTLSFSNHICIQDLQNNFTVTFEVYALQSSTENLAHHERKHSLKRDHGKAKAKKMESKTKLSPVLSSPISGPVKERTSNFGLVGFINFTVGNCNQKVMALEKVPQYSPLDGRMYIRVQLCTQQPVKQQGFLTMFEDVSGFGAWHRRWVVLNGNHLSYWKYPDQVQTEVPIGTIDLRTCVTPEVGLVSADVCARKNTFMLFCVRPKSMEDHESLVSHSQSNKMTMKHLISADTKEERLIWCQQLNGALEIIRRWDPQALGPKDYPVHLQY